MKFVVLFMNFIIAPIFYRYLFMKLFFLSLDPCIELPGKILFYCQIVEHSPRSRQIRERVILVELDR